MDPTEDLSARVLLKHILSTEPPRTPINRIDAQGPSTSGLRRSNRLSKKDGDAQTPQNILRRSLKHKIRETITKKALPATKRRTASVVLRRMNTPATASVLFNDGDTPRHLLMNILQTEPVKSPVVHGKGPSEEPELPSAENTVTRTRSSIELSGLDLPDITFGNVASRPKGLSRKRPHRSLNVTAFEKRLKHGEDADADIENSTGDLSSLSLSSSTSLSLKTPFAEVRTEKRGLQRRVSNRRKISEEEFGAAVIKRQMGGVSSCALVERDLGETAHSEGFSLGLSKLSEPDITADIVNSSTTLFEHPDAMTSNFSIVATQDKPTVMASQLQREIQDMELEEEVEQHQLGTDKSVHVFPSEEATVAESQKDECISEAQLREDAVEAGLQSEDAAVMSKSEEEEDAAESQTGDTDVGVMSEEVEIQTEEEGAASSNPEEDVETRRLFGQEEVALDSQTEEEGAAESQSQESAPEFQSEGDEAGSQSEEKEDAAESQTGDTDVGVMSEEVEIQTEEEGAASSNPEEDVETRCLFGQEEVALDSQTEEEEEGAAESQSQESAPEFQSEGAEAGSQSEEEHVSPDSQTEEEEEGAAAEGAKHVEICQSEEEEVALSSQAEEEEDEEEVAANSQSEDDAEAGSQSEEEEVALSSQAEEEEDEEEVAANSQSEDDAEAGSQSEEEEVALSSQAEEEEDEEEVAANSQSEDEAEAGSQSEEEEAVAEYQTENETGRREEEEEVLEQLEHDSEHISRRAHRSEGAFILPVTEAGEGLTEATATAWSDAKPTAHTTLDLNTSLEMRGQESSQPHTGMPDWAEQEDSSCSENDPEAEKENSFHLEVTQDIEVSRQRSDASRKEAPAQDADEEEYEDEDDDGEEFPCKTPAFVKEKRNFFYPNPAASPSAFENIPARQAAFLATLKYVSFL
ncbi:uncharacterized protein [Leuresthes tenuis]|uniref:uncharacterized protein n=1 Tax=Leuresthes tenuis TaxID=355514 RepID=UPI003B50FA9B